MTCWQTTWRTALGMPLLLFGVAAPARATFLYNITVNTSGLVDSGGNPLPAATQGYLDLQFNPTGGTGTLSATVQTLASNDATLGSVVSSTGNVTGSGLPLTFTADNTNGPQSNDALLNVTYGNTLALSLDITTADANSTASFFLTLHNQYGNPVSPNPGGANPAAVELNLVREPIGRQPDRRPPTPGRRGQRPARSHGKPGTSFIGPVGDISRLSGGLWHPQTMGYVGTRVMATCSPTSRATASTVTRPASASGWRPGGPPRSDRMQGCPLSPTGDAHDPNGVRGLRKRRVAADEPAVRPERRAARPTHRRSPGRTDAGGDGPARAEFIRRRVEAGMIEHLAPPDEPVPADWDPWSLRANRCPKRSFG